MAWRAEGVWALELVGIIVRTIAFASHLTASTSYKWHSPLNVFAVA